MAGRYSHSVEIGIRKIIIGQLTECIPFDQPFFRLQNDLCIDFFAAVATGAQTNTIVIAFCIFRLLLQE
ncbi:hypothetical protein D9M68_889710 [compost metagenome]